GPVLTHEEELIAVEGARVAVVGLSRGIPTPRGLDRHFEAELGRRVRSGGDLVQGREARPVGRYPERPHWAVRDAPGVMEMRVSDLRRVDPLVIGDQVLGDKKDLRSGRCPRCCERHEAHQEPERCRTANDELIEIHARELLTTRLLLVYDET